MLAGPHFFYSTVTPQLNPVLLRLIKCGWIIFHEMISWYTCVLQQWLKYTEFEDKYNIKADKTKYWKYEMLKTEPNLIFPKFIQQ